MVVVATTGWSSVQTVRRRTETIDVAIHAYRAMHAAVERLPQYGVSMRCLAQFARVAGVDHIHPGTAGLGNPENEATVGINDWLRGEFHGHRDVLPVASGGLHSGIVDRLLDAVGTNVMVVAGGGVHGHPDGTEAGARAVRAAVDGESLESRAEDVPPLATALEKWGTDTSW